MANLNTTISILAFSILAGAATVDLNVKRTEQSSEEISLVSPTGGVLIDDFSESLYSWWANSIDKFKLAREKEVLKITVISAGAGTNGYDCFGKRFSMDFTKTPVIKMRVKSDMAGKIRVDLKDANGKITNGKAINMQLPVGDEFKDLYFDFTDKWVQVYPDKAVVNPVEIREMDIYINGGGPEFKGTIYMDDISAMPVSECPK